MPSLNFDDDPSRPIPGQWQRAVPGWCVGLILTIIVAALFAVGYVLLHRGKHAPIFRAETWSAGSTGKVKPSPAIPFGTKPRVAPPPVIASLPIDSAPSSIPASAADGAKPGVVKRKDTEGVYQAKHQKIFGRGCDGRLQLSSMSLDFECTAGSEAPLHLTLDQIRGPSGNGVELKTGEKYHFDLRRGKAEQQEIFRDWAYTHVPGAFGQHE